MKVRMLESEVGRFQEEMKKREYTPNTIQQYSRTVHKFIQNYGEEELKKETLIAWKDAEMARVKPSTVNAHINGMNLFLESISQPELRLKCLRMQKSMHYPEEKTLTRQEYFRMLEYGHLDNQETDALLLATLGATGVRVSEIEFITVEAVRRKEAEIHMKGKHRVVVIPQDLASLLEDYASQQQISSGPVFLTRQGRPMDRTNIWRRVKNLGKAAGICEKKIYPHNIRHLFAREYFQNTKDIAHLADILGHSSVNTTRIYVSRSSAENRKSVEDLQMLPPLKDGKEKCSQ